MAADVVVLINFTVTKDSIGQSIRNETQKTVFCETSSVTGSEWARAGQNGINAEIVMKVFSGDYSEERLCVFRGIRYEIYRTYVSGDTTELYCQKAVGETYGNLS